MAAVPASDYPVSLRAPYPATSSRGWAILGILFLKAIVLLPSLFVLGFLTLAAYVVAWVGYFVILFTGRQPEGIHGFIAGVLQWQARAYAWLFSLTDRYPPFSLNVDVPGAGLGGPSASQSAPLPPAGTDRPAVPPPPPE
jgi:Domain of unknown function (DUF4389)